MNHTIIVDGNDSNAKMNIAEKNFSKYCNRFKLIIELKNKLKKLKIIITFQIILILHITKNV